MTLSWPWQDGKLGFSWLKAGSFALMFVPAILLLHDLSTGAFGPVPLGGLTYWSGYWATAILLLALAITPAATILRWRRIIIVRRMIGVTALAYTIAHIFIYFALRFWNLAFIAHEIVTRLSLIVATASTVGLIALGATSVDAAVRRMGARGWQRLHNAIYAVTALALLHYLLSPGLFPDQFLLSGIFFWLMAWRMLNRRGQGANAGALALLAVASRLFIPVSRPDPGPPPGRRSPHRLPVHEGELQPVGPRRSLRVPGHGSRPSPAHRADRRGDCIFPSKTSRLHNRGAQLSIAKQEW